MLSSCLDCNGQVEVMGHDEGFEGSWYAAEVINAKDYDQLLIQYDRLFEKGNPETELTVTNGIHSSIGSLCHHDCHQDHNDTPPLIMRIIIWRSPLITDRIPLCLGICEARALATTSATGARWLAGGFG